MNKDETFSEYRNLLFSIAYDMLGSVSEAEDLVQETYLKWRTSAPLEITYPKAYLVKIITNLSINYKQQAYKTREKYVGFWLPEPLVTDPAQSVNRSVELYHSLSIGLMVLLEKLTPQERAVFLLKEIFGYDHREIGEIISQTEDYSRQILRRAKQQLGNDHRRFQIDLKVHEEILQRFIDACTLGDLDSLIGLLKHDITLYADGGGTSFEANGQRLTAAPEPIVGPDKVARFVINVTSRFRRFVPDPSSRIMMINGLPALVNYTGDRAINIICFEVEDGKVANLYSHANPEKIKMVQKK